jgi:hypothetical protein
MMGKYLNGYMQAAGHLADGATTDVPATYVPPGWNEWDVPDGDTRVSTTRSGIVALCAVVYRSTEACCP